MKNVFGFLAVILLLFSSCKKPDPIACFELAYTDSLNLEIGFENCSENGISYLWNFGDGDTSTQRNPVHRYAEAGMYEVTLSVTGDDEQVLSTEKSIEIEEHFTLAAYSPNKKTKATKNAKFTVDALVYNGIQKITAHHITGNYQELLFSENYDWLLRDTTFNQELLMPYVFRDSSRFRFTIEDNAGDKVFKDVVMEGNGVDSTNSEVEYTFQSGNPSFSFNYKYGYAEEIERPLGVNMAINLFDEEGDRIRIDNFLTREGTKETARVVIDDSENDRVITETIQIFNGTEALTIDTYDAENKLISGFFSVVLFEGTENEDVLTMRFNEVIIGIYKEEE